MSRFHTLIGIRNVNILLPPQDGESFSAHLSGAHSLSLLLAILESFLSLLS